MIISLSTKESTPLGASCITTGIVATPSVVVEVLIKKCKAVMRYLNLLHVRLFLGSCSRLIRRPRVEHCLLMMKNNSTCSVFVLRIVR